jgi:Na+-driven multidrug efflux pump
MWQRLKENKLFHGFISYAGLFSSFGTLLCCALPSTIVLLGFGASLASFLGDYPQLIWLSEKKEIVFAFSFFMLGLSFVAQKYAAIQACPIDKKQDCESAKSWSKALFYISFGINLVGAFYAFLLPRLI